MAPVKSAKKKEQVFKIDCSTPVEDNVMKVVALEDVSVPAGSGPVRPPQASACARSRADARSSPHAVPPRQDQGR